MMQHLTLLEQQLNQQLPFLAQQIAWYDQVTSTNQLLKQQVARQKEFSPQLLISNQQTNGYGKKGRHFISQTGGLYLSLALTLPKLTAKNQGLLTTGIAWCLNCAIEQQWHLKTQIKWVNDLLIHDQKISGILVEQPSPQVAIIGIGLNLYQKHLTTGTNLLTQQPTEQAICQLIVHLLKQIWYFKDNFATGFFLPDYQDKLAWKNQTVQIQMGQKIVRGQIVGVSQNASLILQTNRGLQVIASGDATKVRTI